ncbi:10463_t:CDS:2 [Gigaspora rosea]|nr:10463_t:CDS:2 [Gigaspora rosea]
MKSNLIFLAILLAIIALFAQFNAAQPLPTGAPSSNELSDSGSEFHEGFAKVYQVNMV